MPDPWHLYKRGSVGRLLRLRWNDGNARDVEITAIIHGRRAVSPDTALRLSRYFGSSAEFRIGLQQGYDLRKARAESGKDIESQIKSLAV
jgi:plasmid maintenance system antidote protein VapI